MKDPPAVRPWLLILFGIVVLGGAWAGVIALIRPTVMKGMQKVEAKRAEVTAAREERQSVRVHATLATVPQQLPLLGPSGTDPDGYPRQYVDRAGLRALLGARDFKALTSYFEQFQAAFESDPRKEYWPSDAGAAFESAEPEIAPALDDWVAATPKSFAPYLARGSHYLAATWARRGHGYRSETPEDDIRAMKEVSTRAAEAVELRPRLVAAMRQELRLALPTSDRTRASKMKDLAFGACPGCFQVRVAYLNSQIPRWGGTYQAIDTFVASLSPKVNPRFRALGGYVDYDRAELAELTDRPRRFDDALDDIDRALGYGECADFLAFRGHVLRALKRYDEALVALDGAVALRPMYPPTLSERAALHANRKEFVAAGTDLLTALRVDPTEPEGKRYATDVMNGLLARANASDAAGKRDEALDAVKLVLELCPEDERALALQAKLSGGPDGSPDGRAEEPSQHQP
jgi:tetratricopeptide (TPR) repeat protein